MLSLAARLKTVTAASAASFVLGSLTGWYLTDNSLGRQMAELREQHIATLKSYADDHAASLRRVLDEHNRRREILEEAVAERDAEILRITDVAARIPPVVGVRIPARCPSVPGSADGVPASPGRERPAGGVVHEGDGGFTVELETERFVRLANRADRVAADLRAVVAACTRR